MENLPTEFEALIREDLRGKQIGLKSVPMPKEIPEGYVLVKVAYAPINPSDWLYFLLNRYGVPEKMTSPPTIAGFEGSGTVVGLGQDVESDLMGAKVAFYLDKTQTLFWGTWTEYTIIPQQWLISFSPETQLEDIHSCFINPLSVFAMGEYFDPDKGGSVLFNAGGSSLCRMAARYLKQRNLKPIMIVRREAHVRELIEDGAEWVIDSSQPGYLETLKSVVNEAQPNIFFDALGGRDALDVLGAMPENSTLYNYGYLSSKHFPDLGSADLIFQNKSVRWEF